MATRSRGVHLDVGPGAPYWAMQMRAETSLERWAVTSGDREVIVFREAQFGDEDCETVASYLVGDRRTQRHLSQGRCVILPARSRMPHDGMKL